MRNGVTYRVDLPIIWLADAVPERLIRRFQRPTGLGADDILSLEFGSAPGLLALTLNGIELGFITDAQRWTFAIPDRTSSTFELELRLDPTSPRTGEEWGRIAIVIESGVGGVG